MDSGVVLIRQQVWDHNPERRWLVSLTESRVGAITRFRRRIRSSADETVPGLPLALVGAHGGAGTSRLMAELTLHATPSTGSFSAEELLPTRSPVGLPVVPQGTVRILVARANVDGAERALRLLEADSIPADVIVAAVEDGCSPPTVPYAASRRLEIIGRSCPVVIVPFVQRWRWDTKANPTKRYRRALQSLALIAEDLHKQSTQQQER